MLDSGLIHEVRGKLKDGGKLIKFQDLSNEFQNFMSVYSGLPLLQMRSDGHIDVSGDFATKRLYMRHEKQDEIKNKLVREFKTYLFRNCNKMFSMKKTLIDDTLTITGLTEFFDKNFEGFTLPGITIESDQVILISSSLKFLVEAEINDVVSWIFDEMERF